MPAIIERATSPEVRVDTSSAEEVKYYQVFGLVSEVDVFNFVVASTPSVLNGLLRSRIEIKAVPSNSSDPIWDVTVGYSPFGASSDGETPSGESPSSTKSSPSSPVEPLGGGYSFDLTAETVHITQSLRPLGSTIWGGMPLNGNDLVVTGAKSVTSFTIPSNPDMAGGTIWIVGGPQGWKLGSYRIVGVNPPHYLLDRSPGAPGLANGVFVITESGPDYRGAINVTDDRIEGTDVFAPKFEWTRTIALPFVTRTYLTAIRNLVGKKNAAQFYHAQPGEVLYLGASGQFTAKDLWSITHKFAEIPNEFNIEIAPGLVVPFKRGWDYLWVQYVPVLQNDVIVHRAAVAYVEEVYPDGDFSLLGIGT